MKIEEMLSVARGIDLNNPESRKVRDLAVQRLAEDDRFPALLSVVVEFEDDLAKAVSDYDRTPEERTMDAGGLATMRKFREELSAMVTPAPVEPEPKPEEKK